MKAGAFFGYFFIEGQTAKEKALRLLARYSLNPENRIR
jgi:hypothetical protein